MALITSPVPEVGAPSATEQADTSIVLTEVKNLLNGGLESDNLSATLKTVATPAAASALPGGPVDGAEVYYVASSSTGVVWHLRWRAAAAKWEYVGGAPLGQSQSGLALTIPAGTTVGNLLAVTPPLAGDYIIDAAVGGGSGAGWSVAVQRVAGPVQLAVVGYQSSGSGLVGRPVRVDGLLAGSPIALAVTTEAGSAMLLTDITLMIRPVRVS